MTNPLAQDASANQADETKADRRRLRRAPVKLVARFCDEAGDERAASVINISAGGALLRAETPARLGERIILYVDEVGRFEATVVRVEDDLFAVDYRGRAQKQRRTAEAIATLMNRGDDREERRGSPRIRVPEQARIVLSSGESLPCQIRDVSLTGASVEVTPRPPVGAHVILGRMAGSVLRHHEGGVVIAFTGSATHMESVIRGSKTAETE